MIYKRITTENESTSSKEWIKKVYFCGALVAQWEYYYEKKDNKLGFNR